MDSHGNQQTLAQTLNARARHEPHRVAYIFLGDGEHESGRRTYAELDADARRVASVLTLELPARARVLLLYADGLDFISAFFGCLYANMLPVPTYPPLRGKRLSSCANIARDCGASAILTTEDLHAMLGRTLPSDRTLARLPVITTDTCEPRSAATDSDSSMVGGALEDVAFIQYTSGTTGNPKGVAVTHANLVNNERVIAEAFEHNSGTTFVGWLPLFHDMGLIGNVLQPMHLGITAVLMPPAAFRQKPVRWLKAISNYRATSSGAPNFAYEFCAARVSEAQKAELDLSSWTLAFNGAEPLDRETLERFSAAFAKCGFRHQAHYPCYGMAEATLFVSGGKRGQHEFLTVDATALERHRVTPVTNNSGPTKQLVGCGVPRLGNELRIVDPHTHSELPSDVVGEIWMSGPSVAAGYWADAALTKSAFRARTLQSPARDWLRTGDLGFMHDGRLYVTGRLLDMIDSDGRWLYPQDIEHTAERSHPHVAKGRVAAFMVAHTLVVAAEVDFGARSIAEPQLLAHTICAAVRTEHDLAAVDVCILRPSTLPITSSGKVRRRACGERYRKGQLDHMAARPHLARLEAALSLGLSLSSPTIDN